jgi:eukaryotic-like serine/threonine-protein kinase
MNPEQWQRVKAVVADALEHDTTRRADFVAAACGDDGELRREVESMLGASGQRVDRVIDRMTHARSSSGDGLAGLRLGAYEIIRETGRGGMGAVYLARRADEEFEKEVAIKLLKRGTDTDEVLRRFRAERQILARLDHPNIARLLDGGTTPDGLPYFVMEYVEGVPITDFARDKNLSLRERVALFLKVCAAVQFAHRNLVVHRDLKPANVLITADGEPKLLDFGIAKLLASDDEFAQLTVQDQQRLTPAYASPEQVRGEGVTTVSDVYALGALLFELLAGRSPHAFASQRPSPTELLRVVVEQEAPRASSVAADAEARRQLRGDLDNILETALRKEPERRYSGVTAFAEDLQRYLSRRPVRARPATLGYRTSRFISRNKLGVAAGILLVATLVGGIAATAWQARKAERRFQQVRKLARAVVFDYHDLIAALPGATAARERLVRDALEYLDNLAREAGNDRVLLRELATAYEKIGKVQGNSYYANLGDTDGAARSYEKSAELRTRLLASDSGNAELLNETALSYEGLGDVQYSKNDLHAALASYRRAIELGQRALAAQPESHMFRHHVARTHARLGDLLGNEQYANLGDTAGALTAFRTAQELVEPLHAKNANDADTISVLANALSRVGMLACASGDVAGGLAAHRRAVAMMEHAVAINPNNQNWAMELLAAKHWLRFALEDDAQFEEAIALSREVLARLEAVSAADPKNTNVRRNIAVTHSMLGRNLLRVGDVAGAIASHRTALSTSEQLSAGKPRGGEKDKDIAIALWGLAHAHAASGQYDAAWQHYRDALAIREPVVAADATNVRARDDVASIYADMGVALTRAGRHDEAIEAFAKALPLAEQLSQSAPTNARLRARLAARYAEAAHAHLQRANGAEEERQLACDYLRKSAAIWQELRDTNRLMPADADKPAQVERELAACDAP